MKISAILVSGGIGSRMQAKKPKQYLPLCGKPIVRYSFELLLPLVHQLIVVCDPSYQFLFGETAHFAKPGPRRQDSVYNGFQHVSPDSELILIHDAARPLISRPLVERVIDAAALYGAAACGIPLKFTVKETKEENFVLRTPNREKFWEIQTPQVVRKDLLKRGFEAALAQNLTVTDDVSLVELLKAPVKLVEGSYSNIKITTPEDLVIAEKLLA